MKYIFPSVQAELFLSEKGITVYEKTKDGERELERSVGSRTVDLGGVLGFIESLPSGTKLHAHYNFLETVPSEIFADDGKKIVFSDGFGEKADLSNGSQEEGKATIQGELAAGPDTGVQGRTETSTFEKDYTVDDVSEKTGISRAVIRRRYRETITDGRVNFSEFLRLVFTDPPYNIKNKVLAAELGFDEQGLREYLGVGYNPLEVRRPLKPIKYTPKELTETAPMKEIGATKEEIKDVAIHLLHIEPSKHESVPGVLTTIYHIPGDLVSGRLEEIKEYVKEKRAQ
jgi:hypothetical protein